MLEANFVKVRAAWQNRAVNLELLWVMSSNIVQFQPHKKSNCLASFDVWSIISNYSVVYGYISVSPTATISITDSSKVTPLFNICFSHLVLFMSGVTQLLPKFVLHFPFSLHPILSVLPCIPRNRFLQPQVMTKPGRCGQYQMVTSLWQEKAIQTGWLTVISDLSEFVFHSMIGLLRQISINLRCNHGCLQSKSWSEVVIFHQEIH